jgi:hypothetical protein
MGELVTMSLDSKRAPTSLGPDTLALNAPLALVGEEAVGMKLPETGVHITIGDEELGAWETRQCQSDQIATKPRGSKMQLLHFAPQRSAAPQNCATIIQRIT